MISSALPIISVLTVVSAVLITSYYGGYADKKSLMMFDRNANRSMCSVCLGNDSFCNRLDFQLDYKRHLGQYSSCLYVMLSVMVRLFNLLTNQQNDQVFFGNLLLDNGSIVHAVAKSPGYFYSEMFEQTVDRSVDINKMIIEDQWLLLPFSVDRHNLVICSKCNIKSNSLLRRFFSSVVKSDVRNNLQPLVEAWTAAHLSVELLVLKVSNYLEKRHLYMYVCNKVFNSNYDITSVCSGIKWISLCS